MTVALGDDAERVERRAEGIINLAFETNLGAAVGGGIGIAVGLLVPSWLAAVPPVGMLAGIALGVVLGSLLLGRRDSASA